jgi:hypothetical protein
MKNVKHWVDSFFILSTALCIEIAPSPPLRAKPGPNITQKAAIVIQSKPKAIPQVVVERYPKVTSVEVLLSIATLSPP